MNIKNVPIQRPQAQTNPENMTIKKPQIKDTKTRPPKELDPNGQPIKKPRQKRAPKPVEVVTIYFRVRTIAEKLKALETDAGFPPTPPASDHEGDEDENEEKKEEPEAADEAKEEEKAAATGAAENPEEKIFD